MFQQMYQETRGGSSVLMMMTQTVGVLFYLSCFQKQQVLLACFTNIVLLIVYFQQAGVSEELQLLSFTFESGREQNGSLGL
jgi:hypothetical protein